MRVNFSDVINASKTKPFGFMPFYPGPGIGGHCIPIDPFYLSTRQTKGSKMRLIETSFKINYLTTKNITRTIINKLKKLQSFGIRYRL